jgi:hypothetical protein
MVARVDDGQLNIRFNSGHTKRWALPSRDDKAAIRKVRDEAVKFAEGTGVVFGQLQAVKKALTEAGYYVAKQCACCTFCTASQRPNYAGDAGIAGENRPVALQPSARARCWHRNIRLFVAVSRSSCKRRALRFSPLIEFHYGRLAAR